MTWLLDIVVQETHVDCQVHATAELDKDFATANGKWFCSQASTAFVWITGA